MPGYFPTGRPKYPGIYKRRCKYCKSELVMIETKTGRDDPHFSKGADAVMCPRCDAPSDPPMMRGAGPGGDDD